MLSAALSFVEGAAYFFDPLHERDDMAIDRRHFMAYFSSAGLAGTLFPGALYARVAEAGRSSGIDADGRLTESGDVDVIDGPITDEMIEAAARIAGLSFSEEHRAMMLEDLNERLGTYASLRALPIPNEVPPALVFDPRIGGAEPRSETGPVSWQLPQLDRPGSDEDIAFLSILEQASLLRSGKLSSVELTRIYFDRIQRYDSVLHAVVTLTEDRAMRQARAADEELSAGEWRGPLHGIPYGAKDLLAVRGYPTTWGSVPYQEQVIDHDAAVVRKLDEAGAVLVAKLTLGALAWGDVWFGGMTRNPWNVDQGSSGSSAGPGSAVAAGLVSFAIGSETLGSIVSPSTRNGISGLRPTFGLVSRDGAMALSWSMDKLGPMARSALDCAVVFDVVRGKDPADPFSRDAGFPFSQRADLSGLRVGYVAEAFEGDYGDREADHEVLDVLRSLGVNLIPVALPTEMPVSAMLLTLEVEAAAAFDELTRSGVTDRMVRQTKDAWPHVFRMARMVPAVEYVQANRARTLLMKAMNDAFSDIDVLVSPPFRGGALSITNLTGHPAVVVPKGFAPVDGSNERRSPMSTTFIGGMYKDAEALVVASAFQEATAHHTLRPPIR
jgi:Asp-tRNA(Asn)/Glu-tRNA(Gln) amidotransferase A subunit family amidase